MQVLYNFGLNDNNIKDMVDLCPIIKNTDDETIIKNIEILKKIECNDKQLKNILISNPFFLMKSSEDISDLITKLKELKVNNLNLLFDSNPFLLNKEVYEIDEYIDKSVKLGKSLINAVDELESNPYIIDEM